jgi:hypothetical protein
LVQHQVVVHACPFTVVPIAEAVVDFKRLKIRVLVALALICHLQLAGLSGSAYLPEVFREQHGKTNHRTC